MRTERHLRGRARRAFSLLEVLIVVVILGILAALVMVAVGSFTDDAEKTIFYNNGRAFVDAAMRFQVDTGDYPQDAASGDVPAGMEAYIQESRWTGVTPIGGVWDCERDTYGLISAIGVHFNGQGMTRDDAYMLTIDSQFDDGDLVDGLMRKIDADRYYFVIAE